MLKVIVLILLLIDLHVLTAFYIERCEQVKLKPLKHCPPFNDSEWKTRAYCKNCTNGKKYHCCKNYDSIKSNCLQDTYDCEEEIFVDGCAVEKFCQIGQEPLLSFVKNQKRADQPEVFCDLCYNSNRYNSHANTSSATYSECPYEKQNICTQETHKIECGAPSNETSERLCRCDVRNGYYPMGRKDDHPSDGCSFTNYDCRNYEGKCMPGEQLLLNYTCAPFCLEGFYRPDNSDECIPYATTESTQDTVRVTTASRKDESTSHIYIIKSSTPRHNVSNDSKTTPPSRDDGKLILTVAIPCAIGGALALIILAILCKKGFLNLRNCRGQHEQQAHEQIPMIPPPAQQPPPDHVLPQPARVPEPAPNVPLPVAAEVSAPADPVGIEQTEGVLDQGVSSQQNPVRDPVGPLKPASKLGKALAPVATPDPSPSFQPRHVNVTNKIYYVETMIKPKKTRYLTVNTPSNPVDAITESRETDTDEKTSFIKRSRSSKSASKGPRDAKDWFKLNDEEYREFVIKVLNLCHGEMLKNLNPVPVLDWFTQKEVFTKTVLTDISEEIYTSNKKRELLNKVKENGTKCYMPFKESLLESKQDSCLRELEEKQEFFANQYILDKRKSTQLGRGHGQDTKSSDDEENKDGNRDQYSKDVSSGTSVDQKDEREYEKAEHLPTAAKDIQQEASSM